eukprot:PhM_4_TR197/c0_g1_i1/m.101680
MMMDSLSKHPADLVHFVVQRATKASSGTTDVLVHQLRLHFGVASLADVLCLTISEIKGVVATMNNNNKSTVVASENILVIAHNMLLERGELTRDVLVAAIVRLYSVYCPDLVPYLSELLPPETSDLHVMYQNVRKEFEKGRGSGDNGKEDDGVMLLAPMVEVDDSVPPTPAPPEHIFKEEEETSLSSCSSLSYTGEHDSINNFSSQPARSCWEDTILDCVFRNQAMSRNNTELVKWWEEIVTPEDAVITAAEYFKNNSNTCDDALNRINSDVIQLAHDLYAIVRGAANN